MLSKKAFCEYAGISIRTLEILNAQGRGPVITKIGRRVLVHPDDAEAWLRSLRQTGEGQVAA